MEHSRNRFSTTTKPTPFVTYSFPPYPSLHTLNSTNRHQTKGWSWRRSGGRGCCCPLTSLKVISLDGTNTGWKQRQQWICWWYKRDHHVLVTSPTISLPTWRPPTLSDSLTLLPPHHPRGWFRSAVTTISNGYGRFRRIMTHCDGNFYQQYFF